MRTQAELLSTVIIVSIAIVLALGMVYYFTPLLVQARANQQIMNTLSNIAAALSMSLEGFENSTGGFKAVTVVINSGTSATRLYVFVLTYNSENLPVLLPSLTYTVYNMSSAAAPLEYDNGWNLLPSVSVDSRHVYVYIKDGYYGIGELKGNAGSIRLFDAGILRPGSYTVLKVEAQGVQPGYVYSVALATRINNNYYVVSILPLP